MIEHPEAQSVILRFRILRSHESFHDNGHVIIHPDLFSDPEANLISNAESGGFSAFLSPVSIRKRKDRHRIREILANDLYQMIFPIQAPVNIALPFLLLKQRIKLECFQMPGIPGFQHIQAFHIHSGSRSVHGHQSDFLPAVAVIVSLKYIIMSIVLIPPPVIIRVITVSIRCHLPVHCNPTLAIFHAAEPIHCNRPVFRLRQNHHIIPFRVIRILLVGHRFFIQFQGKAAVPRKEFLRRQFLRVTGNAAFFGGSRLPAAVFACPCPCQYVQKLLHRLRRISIRFYILDAAVFPGLLYIPGSQHLRRLLSRLIYPLYFSQIVRQSQHQHRGVCHAAHLFRRGPLIQNKMKFIRFRTGLQFCMKAKRVYRAVRQRFPDGADQPSVGGCVTHIGIAVLI